MELGSTLLAVFGIGLLIFLHEGGHFLAARLAGVRVEVFSLGFGPRLCGFELGGTDFRISAVPFGGYVMVAGQDPSDQRFSAEQSLWSKSVAQRALFWSGGVAMNLLFALVAFPLVFGAGVQFVAPVVGHVPVGSAAWEVGLEPGDRIVEVAGKSIASEQSAVMAVALQGDRSVELVVQAADGARRSLLAHPHYDRAGGLFRLGYDPALRHELHVEPDGPAATAGLVDGDVLVAIDGKPIEQLDDISADRPVAVRVARGEQQVEVEVQPTSTTEGVPPMVGIQPLPDRIRGIRPGSELAAALGLMRGDRVLAIDDAPFLADSLDGYHDGDVQTSWLIERDGERRTLEADGATVMARAELVARVALEPGMTLQVAPLPDSAALAAGMRAGDWVRTIDGEPVANWSALQQAVRAAEGRELRFGLVRPDPQQVVVASDEPVGAAVEVRVTARRTPRADFGWQRYASPVMTEVRAESFGEAVQLGTVASLDLIKQLYVTLKRLVTGEVGANNLGGIIRISQVSYQAAQRGATWFWYFLGLLSVNLAFVNLLPIPVLDGGHLLFLLIEKVKGSPVSTRVFGYSQVIGLVFVLLLVLFVTYNDILRLL